MRPTWLPFALALMIAFTSLDGWAHHPVPRDGATHRDAFRQLEEILPTPSRVRLASGAPGPDYWQQKVDYDIAVRIDDEARRLTAEEEITYHNLSPDTLTYLWVQLDQNRFAHDADSRLADMFDDPVRFSYRRFLHNVRQETFPGGYDIAHVRDRRGRPLAHTVVKTMMRVDLPEPLEPGDTFRFEIGWSYQIIEARIQWGRGGYEHFEGDGQNLYEIAQWFPRMAAYTDVDGWQNKQFLGSGEFTLEFGDYRVAITVPDNHIVSATGELQNARSVLTSAQRRRLRRARKARTPMFVVTPEEAAANTAASPKGTKTWVFEAENVRDFAFASSPKFMWDAMGVEIDGDVVMAMSLFPIEGEPLWSRYSTHAVAHTLEIYSRFAFPYPYPVAISVNGPVGGMEYPMICFNGPRPEEDGTYSKRTKYGLISVIIHEVGHNWFPMIVNSDERQWTWMDEGLNTYVQYLAEQYWEEEYPSRRGEPDKIAGYMSSEHQVPIMTNSESLLQFGNNAYGKPATALSILRHTVVGPELFDFAFRTYSRQWMFKRPQPGDLFRILEDASSIDLDWFFRGWFYSTDHVDMAISGITRYRKNVGDPDVDKPAAKAERDDRPASSHERLFADVPKRTAAFPELLDFYNTFDTLDVTAADREVYEKLVEELEPWEKEALATERLVYKVDFENQGGLVMPLILEVTHESGAVKTLRIPAEAWRRDARRVSKFLMSAEPITRLRLDPDRETADVDRSDNAWPREPIERVLDLDRREDKPNPMQKARDAEEKAKEAAEEKAKEAAEEKAKEATDGAATAPAGDGPPPAGE